VAYGDVQHRVGQALDNRAHKAEGRYDKDARDFACPGRL
jgi:uncharacterized protein YjbJ (UPF0337 family)